MKSKHLLILAIFCLLCSCKEKQTGFKISLNSKNDLDTIYVSELITAKQIVKIYKNEGIRNLEMNAPTVAELYTKNKHQPYLTILAKNKDLYITILNDSTLTTNDNSDALLNDLWKSNNEFISKNNTLLFGSNNTDTIPIVFENFRKQREIKINTFKEELSPRILDILHFQNDARIYSFLFYFGRLIKELHPNERYFDFIEKIPKAAETLKSLPDIYLYKYEIEYLRKHQSIESVTDFLRFIEEQTNHKDLADFLKASYIKALIENPSYWQKHEKLFNTAVLSEVLNSEKNNRYSYLIERPSSSFYAAQNGQMAYLFEAEDKFGNKFNLESLIGKVVFIDVWATWCGPCLSQRPNVLQFAQKFSENKDLEILLVSVDSSKKKWVSFLDKENEEFVTNLFIENGMRTDFGNSYNIKSIPRYILIGKNGKLINSNIHEPSMAVEKEIEKALRAYY
jgi:thiol-disulfide isomerase/thioredoxin